MKRYRNRNKTYSLFNSRSESQKDVFLFLKPKKNELKEIPLYFYKMINIGDRFETFCYSTGSERKFIFEVIGKSGGGWYKVINNEVIDTPHFHIPNLKLDSEYNTRYYPIADTLYITTAALFGSDDSSKILLERVE
jgi:hypothetical protein